MPTDEAYFAMVNQYEKILIERRRICKVIMVSDNGDKELEIDQIYDGPNGLTILVKD